MAASETFRTVMLSSGEQRAVSFTEDGGTRGRVLSITGLPFGWINPRRGRLVRQIDDQIKEHYGHAGPRLVQFILRNRKKWPKWREFYQRFVRLWEERAGDNRIAGRLASCLGAISVTAFFAHKTLDLPWKCEDPVAPLWRRR